MEHQCFNCERHRTRNKSCWSDCKDIEGRVILRHRSQVALNPLLSLTRDMRFLVKTMFSGVLNMAPSGVHIPSHISSVFSLVGIRPLVLAVAAIVKCRNNRTDPQRSCIPSHRALPCTVSRPETNLPLGVQHTVYHWQRRSLSSDTPDPNGFTGVSYG